MGKVRNHSRVLILSISRVHGIGQFEQLKTEGTRGFPQVFKIKFVLHEVTTRRGLVTGLLDFGCTCCSPCVRLGDGSLVDSSASHLTLYYLDDYIFSK